MNPNLQDNGAPPRAERAVRNYAITLAILSNKILNYKKWKEYSRSFQEEYLMRKLVAYCTEYGVTLTHYRFEDCDNTSCHLHGVISSNSTIIYEGSTEMQVLQSDGNHFFKSLHLRGSKNTQPFLICEHFSPDGWTRYMNKQDNNPINLFK